MCLCASGLLYVGLILRACLRYVYVLEGVCMYVRACVRACVFRFEKTN